MWKIDWPNTLAYGAITGLTLILMCVFGNFLSERTEFISLTIIFIGASGASAIFLYLVIRWYLSNKLVPEIFDQIKGIATEIGKRSDSDGNDPILWHDLKTIHQPAKALVINILSQGRVILSVFVFMVVTLELLALANAAVMYLQAKRIQEQNKLFENQNRSQFGEMLVNVINIEQIATNRENDLHEILELIEFSLFWLNDLTDPTDGNESIDDFKPMVCSELCDYISPEELSEMAKVGQFTVTKSNAASLKGYAELATVAKQTLEKLTASEVLAETLRETENDGQGSGLGQIADSIEKKIYFAAAICGKRYLGKQVVSLWRGIIYLGRAASMSSFDSFDPKVNNIIRIDPWHFSYFNNSINEIAQSVGKDEISITGPNDAAGLFADVINSLKDGLEEIQDSCEEYQDELSKTVEFVLSEKTRLFEEAQNEIE